jgi:hypothetical protein
MHILMIPTEEKRTNKRKSKSILLKKFPIEKIIYNYRGKEYYVKISNKWFFIFNYICVII